MKKLAMALVASLLIPMGASAWDRSYQPSSHGKDSYKRITSVEILGWQSHISGDIRVDGDSISLKSESSFKSKNRFGFRVSHVLSEKGCLELSYMKNDHSGTINVAKKFENKEYAAGARMRLENSWFDLAYSHNLSRAREADRHGREVFYLDAMVGIKFSKADIDVSGSSDPLKVAIPVNYSESWSKSFPIPYLGIAAGGQIADNIWLKGYFRYLKVNRSGDNAAHADYGVNAALRLNPKAQNTEWFVDLGYRGVRYDLESSNNRADLKYTGPTLGVFARF